ncbi:MAG TPA: hypothetical protein PLQ75_05440, partial [Anaerolineales bacterium]|nr:hypothetical protein [Anaerolineales bacterium]
MTIPAAPTTNGKQQGRVKGSLTSTLVRTLLIFTFIPLALMASVAYFRARSLLREQAVSQLENLITNQVNVVGQNVLSKEAILKEKLAETETKSLINAVLAESPQSSQLSSIRNNLISSIAEETTSGGINSFDDFLIVDKDGIVRLATNTKWQGAAVDPALFNFEETQSKLLQGVAPLIENEPILITSVNVTDGVFVGITSGKALQDLLQPLNGLAPYATAYFIMPGDQILSADPNNGLLSPVTVSSTATAQLQTNLNELKNDSAEASRTLDIELTEGG